jgi:hypothetical protein
MKPVGAGFKPAPTAMAQEQAIRVQGLVAQASRL